MGSIFCRIVHKKNDCCAMSSAFLSPIGERPIDPEEADEELNADQVQKGAAKYSPGGNDI